MTWLTNEKRVIKADTACQGHEPHVTTVGSLAFFVMLLCILIDKVPTHVNLDVAGILFHPLIELSMVQRWLQELNLCLDLLRLQLLDIFSLSYLTVGIGIPTLIHSIYYSSYM